MMPIKQRTALYFSLSLSLSRDGRMIKFTSTVEGLTMMLLLPPFPLIALGLFIVLSCLRKGGVFVVCPSPSQTADVFLADDMCVLCACVEMEKTTETAGDTRCNGYANGRPPTNLQRSARGLETCGS